MSSVVYIVSSSSTCWDSVTSALGEGGASEAFSGAVDLLLSIRAEAKSKKDWATSDRIRDELAALGFTIKDTKEGTEWSL